MQDHLRGAHHIGEPLSCACGQAFMTQYKRFLHWKECPDAPKKK